MKKCIRLKKDLLDIQPMLIDALDSTFNNIDKVLEILKKAEHLKFQTKEHVKLLGKLKVLQDHKFIDTEIERLISADNINMVYLQNILDKAKSMNYESKLTDQGAEIIQKGISQDKTTHILEKAVVGYLEYDQFNYYLNKAEEIGIKDSSLIKEAQEKLAQFKREREVLREVIKEFEDSSIVELLTDY